MLAEAPAPVGTAPLVVTFKVGRQSYALPLGVVLQVVRLPALTTVPGAPPGLCGMLNLRGNFIPVLDAHVILEEPPSVGLESQILVLSNGIGERPVCSLMVDAVEMVRQFPPGSFAPLTNGNDLVVGMLRERDEAVVVLDAEALAAHAAHRGT
ncbi:MAG: chemotaxis protein CheW [Oscillochloridaceae bacterium umkhey_bin13]